MYAVREINSCRPDRKISLELRKRKAAVSYPSGVLEDKVQRDPRFFPLRSIRQETSHYPNNKPQKAREKRVPG